MRINAKISTLIWLIPLWTYGQNIMIIPDNCGFSGDTVEIYIEVENTESFVGFQFDLPLPASVDYLLDSAVLTSRANDHTLMATLLAGDTLRVICYSMNLLPFSGNSGPVMTFQIVLGGSPGTYPLNLNNAVLANSNSQNILTGVGNGYLYLIGPVAPESFDLLYPPEGAIILDTAITFDWNDASDLDPIDTLEYTFYWSADSSWTDYDSIPDIVVSTYSFSGTQPFPEGQTVWWKVKVTDCYGLSNYSQQIWSFAVSSSSSNRSYPQQKRQTVFEFGEISPNPFNSNIVISYELYQPADISLKIYDLQGRMVKAFIFMNQTPNSYQTLWQGVDQNGFPISSGVYFCQLSSGNYYKSKIIILIK